MNHDPERGNSSSLILPWIWYIQHFTIHIDVTVNLVQIRFFREVDFLLKLFFVLKFFFQSFVVNSSQVMENSSFNLRTKKLYFLLSKILSLFSSFNLLSIWEARNFIFFFQSSFNLRSWNLYFLLLIFFQFEKPVSTLNH